MSKNHKKEILKNNLNILELNRFYTVSQFLENDITLFESILDSELSKNIEQLSIDKIKILWIDYLWQIAITQINKEEDIELRNYKLKSFLKIYKNKISELYEKSEEIIDSDIYIDTIKNKRKIIESLLKIGIKGEKNINQLKLEIRINSNHFKKTIENEKFRNIRNV